MVEELVVVVVVVVGTAAIVVIIEVAAMQFYSIIKDIVPSNDPSAYRKRHSL